MVAKDLMGKGIRERKTLDGFDERQLDEGEKTDNCNGLCH